jgi:hypothetical protein
MEAIWLAVQMPPTLALPLKGGGDLKAVPRQTASLALRVPTHAELNTTKDPIE